MTKLLMPNLDLLLVAVLVFVAIVVALLSRIGLLPKKSIPYVAAALLATIGFALFKSWKRKAELNVLEDNRKKLRAQEQVAEEARKKLAADEAAMAPIDAEIQRVEAAQQRRVLVADARDAARRREIEALSDEEVFRQLTEASRK